MSNPAKKTGRQTPTRKLIRKASSHKDLRPIGERITLERVLGITASNNATFTCDPNTGRVAYLTGCVVVLFNPRGNKQSFIINTCRKTLSSLAFSGDGKYLVTGEAGHLPAVRVWDLEDLSHPQVGEMVKAHKFGISCVAFSPNMKFIISVGYQHDMLVNIWNWKAGSTVACNKVSTKVLAMSFSEKGDHFVTVGNRMVKFWYIDTEAAKGKNVNKIPLLSRAGILADLRNNCFCDVACGVGENASFTYCVTTSAKLCSFTEGRGLDKWVELKASKAFCMAVSEKFIFCGCSDGIIRVFDPSTLTFVATLPKPHFLGINVTASTDPSHLVNKQENAKYPDTVALGIDNKNMKISAMYNDHSVYVWDVHDVHKVGKVWSNLYHGSCIWGVEIYPDVEDENSALPPGTFLTGSSDDTVRMWNINDDPNILIPRNIYSKDLLRVLYIDTEYGTLKDPNCGPGLSNKERDAMDLSKHGVRSLTISQNGKELAIGDRSGNVRLYDMAFMDELLKIEAHEGEILCIEFSDSNSGHKLLATASRDRLIHIFDMDNNLSLLQTFDDHSASITSVKFTLNENNDFQLLSCAADKSVVFRTAQKNPDFQFVRNTNYVGKATFYDMIIDPQGKFAAVAGQDRNVRIFDVITGKQNKCYKGALSEDGTLIKVHLDRSGTYLATSCSDKTVYVYDFESGECMATVSGHSEVVTGLRFTNDCRKLITVSGDGCIFIWSLPSSYTQIMLEKLSELGQDQPKQPQSLTPLRRETYNVPKTSKTNGAEEEFRKPDPAIFDLNVKTGTSPNKDYRFSVSQLPSWAQKQIAGEEKAPKNGHSVQQPQGPEGRWAQRYDASAASQLPAEDGNFLPLSMHNGAAAMRLTVETDFLDQLSRTPLEGSPASDLDAEGEEFFSANSEMFDKLNKKHEPVNGTLPMVNVKRGSDLTFCSPLPLDKDNDSLEMIEIVEVQDPESPKEEEVIYLPPPEEELDAEVARAFQVTSNNGHAQTNDGTEDNKDEEEPAEDEAPTSDRSPREDDDSEEDKGFLKTNFECLGSTPTQFEETPDVTMPLQAQNFLNTRLSISRRFLSKSQSSKGPVNFTQNGHHETAENDEKDVHKPEAVLLSDEKKKRLQMKQDEMTKAVDMTRKRLEALGMKSLSDANKRSGPVVAMAPASSTNHVSSSSTNHSSSSAVTTKATGVSSVISTTSVSTAISSVDVVTKDALQEEMDLKKSATDLIAFFNHAKGLDKGLKVASVSQNKETLPNVTTQSQQEKEASKIQPKELKDTTTNDAKKNLPKEPKDTTTNDAKKNLPKEPKDTTTKIAKKNIPKESKDMTTNVAKKNLPKESKDMNETPPNIVKKTVLKETSADTKRGIVENTSTVIAASTTPSGRPKGNIPVGRRSLSSEIMDNKSSDCKRSTPPSSPTKKTKNKRLSLQEDMMKKARSLSDLATREPERDTNTETVMNLEQRGNLRKKASSTMNIASHFPDEGFRKPLGTAPKYKPPKINVQNSVAKGGRELPPDPHRRTQSESNAPVTSKSSSIPGISELSAQLSAAIATPPPEPMKIPFQDKITASSKERRAPIGKESEVTAGNCQEVMEQAVKAFQNFVHFGNKVMKSDKSDNQEEMRTMVCQTFEALHEKMVEFRKDHYNQIPQSTHKSISSAVFLEGPEAWDLLDKWSQRLTEKMTR